jgi:hypothetical protein
MKGVKISDHRQSLAHRPLSGGLPHTLSCWWSLIVFYVYKIDTNRTVRLGIFIIFSNHASFNDNGFVPPSWNNGMLEQWNNGQKRINSMFGSRFSIMICLPAYHAGCCHSYTKTF